MYIDIKFIINVHIESLSYELLAVRLHSDNKLLPLNSLLHANVSTLSRSVCVCVCVCVCVSV